MRQLSLKGRTFPTDLNHAVTVSVSNLNFIKPIHNGDVFMVYTKVDRIGNTSIDIGVELIVRSRENLSEYKVTQGVFTFVAVDEKGKPVQIKSVLRSYVAPYIMEMLGDK